MGKKEKTDENSGYYDIASSRPPEHRPLERRTLVPILLEYATKWTRKRWYKCFVFRILVCYGLPLLYYMQ